MTLERSSEVRPCIIGVQSCGCITYANSMPDDLMASDRKTIEKIIRNGGSILHTTVEDAHSRPYFMPMECPHDPKGWQRKPRKPR